MRFDFTPELQAYIRDKGKEAIVVEVAVSDSSDFEVAELHVHFTSSRQAELFQSRKGFHRMETEVIPVLLPNYRLEYGETVTFALKRLLFIPYIKQTGIKL